MTAHSIYAAEIDEKDRKHPPALPEEGIDPQNLEKILENKIRYFLSKAAEIKRSK